jgi:hypothetical protein
MNAIVSIGATVGLLASLNVFGQLNTQVRGPSNPPPVRIAFPDVNKVSAARANYVGDGACAQCHREKVDSFHQTSHYLTSRLPDKSSILGKFTKDSNTRGTSNPELSFRMDEKADGFFQTAVVGIDPYTTERTERFGLVVGSGGKGQTYLFWKDDKLFELPVSYWTELGWVNSPGYRDGVANFDRVITPRCLECHATYFESMPPPPNRYDKSAFVLGITCEKCHGPGREHVQFEESKPAPSSDPVILRPKRFSRDRQMDLCGWCHSGAGVTLAPAFSYLPGGPLGKYLQLPAPDPNAKIDVHGSQVELLEKSRCFQASAMTCLTCHDIHTVQHDPSDFSQHCLSCHKPGTVTFPKRNHHAESNCIDCHMPCQETSLIVFNFDGKQATPTVRSHWIRVYPATTRPK